MGKQFCSKEQTTTWISLVVVPLLVVVEHTFLFLSPRHLVTLGQLQIHFPCPRLW